MHKLITDTIQTISCPNFFDLSLEWETAVYQHKSFGKYTLVNCPYSMLGTRVTKRQDYGASTHWSQTGSGSV